MVKLILAQASLLSGWTFLLAGLIAVVALAFLAVLSSFGLVYVRALFSGAKVTFFMAAALSAMRERLSEQRSGKQAGNRLAKQNALSKGHHRDLYEIQASR